MWRKNQFVCSKMDTSDSIEILEKGITLNCPTVDDQRTMADSSQTKDNNGDNKHHTVSTPSHSKVNNEDNKHSELHDQSITRSSKKRLLSPDSQDQEGTPNKSKKIRGTSIIPKTRKPKITRVTKPKKTGVVNNPNPDVDIGGLFKSMMEKFDSLHFDFTDRLDRFEKSIEQKITEKVAIIVDTKLKSATDDIRVEITQEIKQSVSTEVSDIKSRLEQVENRNTNTNAVSTVNNRELNLVIRNLPQNDREKDNNDITVKKVKSLLTDGLKLNDISVNKVERKHTRSRKPGVVILTVDDLDNKKDIFASKNKLAQSKQFKDVFIENDTPYEQRVNNANMSKLLHEMGARNLTIHKGRIVNRNSTRGSKGHDLAPPADRRDYRPRDGDSGRQSNRNCSRGRDNVNNNNRTEHMASSQQYRGRTTDRPNNRNHENIHRVQADVHHRGNSADYEYKTRRKGNNLHSDRSDSC